MTRVVGRQRRDKDEVVARNGVVSTKHPIASQRALDVLEAGGNAVDAAVVAALCIGTLLPQASGIGGGGYLAIADRHLHFGARAHVDVPWGSHHLAA